MDTIINISSLLANICVLFLTAMTFYLTVMSNKLKFISFGFSSSIFNGETISLSLENTTLHPISITSISLIKKMEDGVYHSIDLVSYDDPLVIEGRRVAKITTDPYTCIWGLDSLTDLHMNAIFCIKSGSKTLFVKPYKRAPLKEVKKVHKKDHVFAPLSVMRNKFNHQVVSRNVRYAIHIRAGKNSCDWNTILLTKHGVLDGTICGYNGLDTSKYDSEETLKAYLVSTFNIPSEDIHVQLINNM